MIYRSYLLRNVLNKISKFKIELVHLGLEFEFQLGFLKTVGLWFQDRGKCTACMWVRRIVSYLSPPSPKKKKWVIRFIYFVISVQKIAGRVAFLVHWSICWVKSSIYSQEVLIQSVACFIFNKPQLTFSFSDIVSSSSSS